MTRELDRLFRFDEKSVVVVGAASGIGKAAATLFAEAGAHVIVADRDQLGAEAVAETLKVDGGSSAAATVDVRDEQSVAALFETIGEVDVVVNCVGVYPKTPLLETTVDDWDLVQNVNLKGAFLCIREAARSMVAARRGGSIVSVSSISSLHPSVIGNSAYGASKGGLNVLTKTAALELGPHQIRVNSILPGGTATEGAMKPSPAPRSGPILNPGRILMDRIAQPVEIAAGIFFLASPAASYMTGQALVLDGGFLVT
jgi:NAD(P)-dependent dehydrogenase (short-subunit alcohol dehydrogenase family)